MKKFVLFLIWIFFIVSCEKPSDKGDTSPPPSGFGDIEGHLCFKILTDPLQGYDMKIAGKTATTDVNGYFAIYKIPEGVHKLEVWLGTKLVYEANMKIISDVTIPIIVPLLYKKGDLPDEIVVIDISNDFAPWNFMVRGKDKSGYEQCFWLDEENSLPKAVSFYQFEKDEYYEIEFYETEFVGLPKRVKTKDYIFTFGNFNGNKFDFGILYPSGEVQVIRDIETDFDWSTTTKGTMSKSDVLTLAY